MPTLWWLQLKGWPIGGWYTQIPQRPWGFYGSPDMVTFQSKALHLLLLPWMEDRGGSKPQGSQPIFSLLPKHPGQIWRAEGMGKARRCDKHTHKFYCFCFMKVGRKTKCWEPFPLRNSPCCFSGILLLFHVIGFQLRIQSPLPSPLIKDYCVLIKDYCVPGIVLGALQTIFISHSNLAKELLECPFCRWV